MDRTMMQGEPKYMQDPLYSEEHVIKVRRGYSTTVV